MKKYIVNIILFLCDSFVLLAIYYAVRLFRQVVMIHNMPSLLLSRQEDFLFVYVLIGLILVYEKVYKYRFDFWEETKLVLKALILSFVIVLAFLMLNKINTEYSRSFIVMYFVALMIFLPICKRFIKKFLFSFAYFKRRVKIIGNKEQKEVIKKEFKENWYLGLQCVESNHEAIFIATKGIPLETLNGYLNQYMKETQDLYLLPYISKVNFSEANMMEYFNIRTSVIHIENELLKLRNIFIKALFEKSVTLLILPLVALLHIVIVLVIKLDSKGAIFFRQERLGKDNKPFVCYKYRTMYENSENLLKLYLENHPEEIKHYQKYHKYKNDPRITKIGHFLRKTSLDELAQIINVLQGNMSIIGPRPYMLNEITKFADVSHTILSVKPGITGLWQVSGRSNLTFENRKELDIWYIQNWSLWMDLIILFKTIKVVLTRQGAQ